MQMMYFVMMWDSPNDVAPCANIAEGKYAHGRADFVAKLEISLKETNETSKRLKKVAAAVFAASIVAFSPLFVFFLI